MKPAKHFGYLMSIAAAPLAAAVAENADLFNDITIRQHYPGTAHADTETIFLRMPEKLDAPTMLGCLHEVPYLAWGIAPLRHAAQSIASFAGGRLGRVMVIRCRPGGKILPHIDQGDYAEMTERYHLAIATNAQAWLESGGERRHIPLGEVWWFDKRAMHSGANDGATPRIHMVVDVYREPLWQS